MNVPGISKEASIRISFRPAEEKAVMRPRICHAESVRSLISAGGAFSAGIGASIAWALFGASVVVGLTAVVGIAAVAISTVAAALATCWLITKMYDKFYSQHNPVETEIPRPYPAFLQLPKLSDIVQTLPGIMTAMTCGITANALWVLTGAAVLATMPHVAAAALVGATVVAAALLGYWAVNKLKSAMAEQSPPKGVGILTRNSGSKDAQKTDVDQEESEGSVNQMLNLATGGN